MRSSWLKIPAILYAGLIFGLSSLEKAPIEMVPIWNIDKLVHMLEYAIFGILLMLAFSGIQRVKFLQRADFRSAVVGVLFGLSDEIHQYYVPGRISSIGDLGADSVGILLGIWLFKRLKMFRKYREL